MIDVESALADALQNTADTDVHVEQLLSGARSTGMRYRRRHRTVLVGGAVVSAALALAVVALVRILLVVPDASVNPAANPAASGEPRPAPSGPPGPTPAPSGPPGPTKITAMTEMPSLPPAPAAKTAQTAPAELGRDPLLVHLSLAKLPYPAAVGVSFRTGKDGESIMVQRQATGKDEHVNVEAVRDSKKLTMPNGTQRSGTVNSRPAVITVDHIDGREFAAVRWQPAAGLWVQVSGSVDLAIAQTVANDVRLDRVYQCRVPFRFTGAPAGAHLESCSVQFGGGGFMPRATIDIGAWAVTVDLLTDPVRGANEVLGGRPARVLEHPGDGGKKIMEITIDLGNSSASLVAEGPYDPAVVRAIAAGVTVAGGSDPASWPANPLG
jgi:hypothetical protein